MKFINKVSKNNQGQTVLEYIVLSGLIGILCLFSIRDLGKTLESKIKQTTKKVNSAIKVR
jgi:Flp pilus assembly pilin Flp